MWVEEVIPYIDIFAMNSLANTIVRVYLPEYFHGFVLRCTGVIVILLIHVIIHDIRVPQYRC